MADVFGLVLGTSHFSFNSFPLLTEFVLDGVDDRVGFSVQHNGPAATITRVGINVGSVTGTPPSYRIGLQQLDSSGNPNGTWLGGGTPAYTDETSFVADWNWFTLDNSYSMGVGEFFAVVVEYQTGTVNASNNIGVNYYAFVGGLHAFPYSGTSTTATPTWGDQPGFPPVGWGASATAYGYPMNTMSNLESIAASGNRMAAKFTLPAGITDTIGVRGFIIRNLIHETESFLAGIWDASSAIETIDVPSGMTADADDYNRRVIYFDAVASLTAGTTYYVGVESQSATQLEFRCLQVAAAADMEAWPLGSNYIYSEFASGAWNDVDTKRPFIDLILESMTEPAGGGGGLLVHPGMGGGARG